MRFTVHDNFTTRAAAMLANRADRAGHILAVQVEKDTQPFVPMLTGSQIDRTRVIGSSIIYHGPYARHLYNGKVMVDAATGKGPMRIVDKFGNEYIRFHKGAKLKPTERPLKYTKDNHKDAGPRWFERSKAKNLDEWERVAAKVMTHG